jgi:competence protein ComEC
VTFLSVGHGCAAVVELPDGRVLLCDAGHMGSPDAGGRTIASYLWSRGITRIDGLVISHADADHFNAVPYLLERFDVAKVFVSPVMFDESGKKLGMAVTALKSAIETSAAELETVSEGQRLNVGGAATVRVLLPPAEGVIGSDNANSVVLAVEYGGHRVLITGDLEGRGLSRLLERPAYDVDVLLAPHHGSLGSSPPEFAAWAKPDFVIVSGGFRGNFTLLEDVYGQVGAMPLHTARVGAIQAAIDANGLRVTTLGRQRFSQE